MSVMQGRALHRSGHRRSTVATPDRLATFSATLQPWYRVAASSLSVGLRTSSPSAIVVAPYGDRDLHRGGPCPQTQYTLRNKAAARRIALGLDVQFRGRSRGRRAREDLAACRPLCREEVGYGKVALPRIVVEAQDLGPLG